jgi:hypothetical protein
VDAALLLGAASGEAQALELASPRGRPLPALEMTLRMMRRLQHTTPWSAGWIGRTAPTMS